MCLWGIPKEPFEEEKTLLKKKGKCHNFINWWNYAVSPTLWKFYRHAQTWEASKQAVPESGRILNATQSTHSSSDCSENMLLSSKASSKSSSGSSTIIGVDFLTINEYEVSEIENSAVGERIWGLRYASYPLSSYLTTNDLEV